MEETVNEMVEKSVNYTLYRRCLLFHLERNVKKRSDMFICECVDANGTSFPAYPKRTSTGRLYVGCPCWNPSLAGSGCGAFKYLSSIEGAGIEIPS